MLLWFLVPFNVPLASFWTPAIGYFIAAGLFAPGLGRTLTYMGIERVGIARSVPIVNCSPVFASIFAVYFLGESWPLQNFLGTLLVIIGVVILSSSSRYEQRPWRPGDLVYPLMGALTFGISTNLRKLGLVLDNLPLMAATVTAATSLLFNLGMLQARGGREVLMLTPPSLGWFLGAGLCNTRSILLVFLALSSGKVVVVEPLVSTNPILSILLSLIFLRGLEAITVRGLAGAFCTVLGTILVLTL